MSTIQDIFAVYGSEYLARYGTRMPHRHKQVLHAISTCRTSQSGTIVYTCPDCHAPHLLNSSCGNRHCPMCQQHKAERWLEHQLDKLLPCSYFLITVTLPAALRGVVRSNQRIGYDALFQSVHASLKKLASDPRFVGTSRIGCLSALHTWGAQLQYHPHLHVIIPAGGLSPNGIAWQPSREDLFVHTRPLAVMIRATYKHAMQQAGLLPQIPAAVWQQQWVVHSEHAGNGSNALRYLGRYVNRVAISNNRIRAIDPVKRTVTIACKDRSQNRWRTIELDVMEFIRRFLQHVLPHGFMKIRHIGMLNGNSTVSIEGIRLLIQVYNGYVQQEPHQSSRSAHRPLQCRHCGSQLKYQRFIAPDKRRYTG